jgi:hypothetical protein
LTGPPLQPSYDSDEMDLIAAHANGAGEHVCDDCGRAYANARGLAIHRGKAHRSTFARAKRKPASTKANGKQPAAHELLRELVAKLDRLAEARTEITELEQQVDELQRHLVEAWT